MNELQRYAEEKFSVAVDALATSSRDIRERIYSAYLSFAPIRPAEYEDAGLTEMHESLIRDLTKVEAKRDEGQVQATLATLSDDECEKIAERIFAIYELVHDRRVIDDYESDRAADLEE
jgi:hypothetical protein